MPADTFFAPRSILIQTAFIDTVLHGALMGSDYPQVLGAKPITHGSDRDADRGMPLAFILAIETE